MNEQRPLPRHVAAREVVRCAAVTARLLARRETHLRSQRVGMRVAFADGTSARVFRETVVDGGQPPDSCMLVVAFRLRFLRGRWHSLFLWECILNTPLFVGFPGFVSKLWLDHDEHDNYRGLYEWSDPVGAERYARSLWRVLDLVCPPESVRYIVLPGYRRDEVLRDPRQLDAIGSEGGDWWRVVAVS